MSINRIPLPLHLAIFHSHPSLFPSRHQQLLLLLAVVCAYTEFLPWPASLPPHGCSRAPIFPSAQEAPSLPMASSPPSLLHGRRPISDVLLPPWRSAGWCCRQGLLLLSQGRLPPLCSLERRSTPEQGPPHGDTPCSFPSTSAPLPAPFFPLLSAAGSHGARLCSLRDMLCSPGLEIRGRASPIHGAAAPPSAPPLEQQPRQLRALAAPCFAQSSGQHHPLPPLRLKHAQPYTAQLLAAKISPTTSQTLVLRGCWM
jgi:hypothetical protein